MLRDILRPGEELATERVTVPVNPLMLLRLTELVAVEPLVSLREEGLADIEKSPGCDDETANEIVVLCVSEPLMPVTVRV